MDIRNLSENVFIKDLLIILKDIDSNKEARIQTKEITDLELDYTIPHKVTGFFKFLDLFQIEKQLNTSNNLRVIIFYLDQFGKYTKREFKVTTIEKTRLGVNDTFTFRVQDIISYELSRVFKSKNYQKVKLNDVFNEYFKQYIKPLIDIKGSVQSFDEIEFLNIPNNVSFFDFMIEEIKKYGFIYYNTRNGFVIQKVKDILTKSLPFNNFKYQETCENRYYQYKILEYYEIPKKKDLQLPKTQNTFYNPKTKTLEVSSKHNIDEVVKSSTQRQFSQGSGFNNRIIENPEGQIAKNLMDYVNNNAIKIFVAQDMERNDRFRIFNVFLNGSNGFLDTTREGNVKLSGLYVSLGFKDKIFGGAKCITEVILGRFDNPSY